MQDRGQWAWGGDPQDNNQIEKRARWFKKKEEGDADCNCASSRRPDSVSCCPAYSRFLLCLLCSMCVTNGAKNDFSLENCPKLSRAFLLTVADQGRFTYVGDAEKTLRAGAAARVTAAVGGGARSAPAPGDK